MIGQLLGQLEKGVEKVIDDETLFVDALYDRHSGTITLFVNSKEHDPSVGIFGGLVVDAVWNVEGEEETALYDISKPSIHWNIPIGRKRWGAPEGWGELSESLRSDEVRKLVRHALIQIDMRPF